MSYLSTFFLIGGLYLIAAASPGPNFFIISQLSLAGERHRACLVAAGITAGSTLWASSAMAGLAALLLHLSWLSFGLKLAGAAYLVWYGLKLLPSAGKRGTVPETSTGGLQRLYGESPVPAHPVCLVNSSWISSQSQRC